MASALAAEIEADIDRWVQFYPDIQGIFLDAQASGAEHVDLYAGPARLRAAEDQGGRRDQQPRDDLRRGLLLAIGRGRRHHVREQGGLRRPSSCPAWARKYPARPFAAIPYSMKTAGRMKDAAQQAVLKGIGYFYVTDARDAQPLGPPPSLLGRGGGGREAGERRKPRRTATSAAIRLRPRPDRVHGGPRTASRRRASGAGPPTTPGDSRQAATTSGRRVVASSHAARAEQGLRRADGPPRSHGASCRAGGRGRAVGDEDERREADDDEPS